MQEKLAKLEAVQPQTWHTRNATMKEKAKWSPALLLHRADYCCFILQEHVKRMRTPRCPKLSIGKPKVWVGHGPAPWGPHWGTGALGHWTTGSHAGALRLGHWATGSLCALRYDPPLSHTVAGLPKAASVTSTHPLAPDCSVLTPHVLGGGGACREPCSATPLLQSSFRPPWTVGTAATP